MGGFASGLSGAGWDEGTNVLGHCWPLGPLHQVYFVFIQKKGHNGLILEWKYIFLTSYKLNEFLIKTLFLCYLDLIQLRYSDFLSCQCSCQFLACSGIVNDSTHWSNHNQHREQRDSVTTSSFSWFSRFVWSTLDLPTASHCNRI